MTKIPEFIHTVEQLTDSLNGDFVIFFGSAVSGVSTPRLPMVYPAMSSLVKGIAGRLRNESGVDTLIAKYADSLIQGPHKSILETTKFETYLARLATSVGKSKVNDLLTMLYVCEPNEYGPNHSAIAFLLKHRICTVALTTNFDNALELAYPKLRVIDHEDSPTRLPQKEEEPLLIKLHGDAIKKSCVATSPELTAAKVQNRYAFLRDILANKKILVVGYSGNGDVDISLHLNKVDGELFWCDRNITEDHQAFPNRTYVKSDLSARLKEPDNGGNQNLLIQLANSYGWRDDWDGDNHSWENHLEEWVKDVPTSDLGNFILSLHSWHTNWPSLHIAYRKFQDEPISRNRFSLAEAELQVSAYDSAIANYETLLKDPAISPEMNLFSQAYLGFALWRKGDFLRAIETIKPIAAPKFFLPEIDSSKSTLPKFAPRQYLEVIDEVLSYETSLKRRQELGEEWEVDTVMIHLRDMNDLITIDEYLSRAARFRMDYFTGKLVSVTEVKDLFEECVAMEEWAAASIAVQLLLLVSNGRSISELRNVNRKLFERRQYKLIRKNIAYFIHALLGQKFPFILKALNGRSVMRAGILVTEARYKVMRFRWNRID